MIFRLPNLLASPCPNLWHSLVAVGAIRNGQLEVPDAKAIPLLAVCSDAPKSVVAEAPSMFTTRLRTEAEKRPLRFTCADCEFNVANECRGSSCCGGQVPVEIRLNLASTNCPQGRWSSS